MLNLTMKDLSFIKKDIILALFLGLTVFPLLSIFTSLPEWALFIFLFFSVFHLTNHTLKTDDKNKTTRFLLTLPVKINHLVYSRYFTLIILIILFTCWGSIIYLFSGYLGWESQSSFFEFLLPVIFYPVLIFSVILPLYFKLGYFKAMGLAQVLAIIFILLFFSLELSVFAFFLNSFSTSFFFLLSLTGLIFILSIKLSCIFIQRW